MNARNHFIILWKKETLAQFFSCDFCEISKNTFFIEHLRSTASVKLRNEIFVWLVGKESDIWKLWKYWPISCRWSLPIPPENIRKPLFFLILSRGMERRQWHETDQNLVKPKGVVEANKNLLVFNNPLTL